MVLKDYEDEILIKMYDNSLIGYNYKPIQTIASKINWMEIQYKYGVNPKFRRVLRHLSNKGYVNLHGKSGNTASLTRLGVAYVLGKQSQKYASNQ